MAETAEAPRHPRMVTTPVRIARWGLIVIAVVLVFAAVRAAAIIVLPLLIAFWLSLMLWPLHKRLSRFVPAWLSAAASAIIAILASLLLAWWAWFAASSAVARFTGQQQRLTSRLEHARQWLIDAGIPSRWLPHIDGASQTPGPGSSESLIAAIPPDVRDALIGWLTGGVESLLLATIGFLLAVFLMFLVLVEIHSWRQWFTMHLKPNTWRWLRDVVDEWGGLTRRYFLSKVATGTIAGSATGVWLWIMGVPLAWVWAGLSFLLNFIPNIGAIISSIPPILLTFLEQGFWQAAVVAAGLLAIETLVGNLVAPVIDGNFLRLSPFVVLVSLIFWGWLWGVIGALLAPILTAAIVRCFERVRVHRGNPDLGPNAPS